MEITIMVEEKKKAVVKKTVASKADSAAKTTKAVKAQAAEPAVWPFPGVDAETQKTPAVKKPAARKPAVKKATANEAAEQAVAQPSPEERYRMVETAAYYIAERSGFQGCATEFWAAAEIEIANKLGC
jgi:hypothetical protein